ncbi:oligosaccharide flippase family protein [Photobacterium damselae]|uniref:oligosaccharide flippase family protein n=1 Tax=Photobacterium damselae TaxID=38293 RepID=UPI004067F6CE
MTRLLSFFASNLMVKFFMFGSQILVALYLTPNEIGNIKTTQTVIELIVTFSIFGLNTAFIREYSVSENNENQKEIKNVCFNLILYISISCTFISLLFSYIYSSSLYYILYLTTPFISLTTLIIYFYQVDNKYIELARSQFWVKCISAIIIIVVTYLFKLEGFIISTIFVSILSFYYLFRPFVNDVGSFKYNSKIIRKCFDISKYALFSTIIGVITNYCSYYIASALYQGTADLGYLAFAMNIFLAFEILTSTIQQYFLPKLTRLSDKIILWKNEFYKLNLTLIIFHILISITLYFLIDYIESIEQLKSFQYYNSLFFLKMFIVSWGVSGLSAYKGIAILSLGKVQYTLINNVMMLPIVIFSSYYFVNKFDVNGVVFSKVFISFISYFVMKYCLYLALRKFK